MTGGSLSELQRNWRLLLGSSLGAAVGISVYPVYVVPLVGLQLERLLHWSRTETALLSTAVTLGALAGALVVGRIIDAFGARWPAVASAVAMGAVLSATPVAPLTPSAWRTGAFVFALVGAASLPISYSRVVCDAFQRRRGLALGLTFGAVGLAGAILPAVLLPLIANWGAVGALQFAGWWYLLVLAPALALLLRRPGVASGGDACPGAEEHQGGAPTRLTAWVALGVSFALLGCATTGCAVSLPALSAESRGGSPAVVVGVMSLSAMAARPSFGFLLDLLPAPWVGAGAAFSAAAGLAAAVTFPTLLPMAAALIGLALGAEFDVLSFLVARYAGPAWQSRAFSALYALVLGSVALGPYLVARARVETGEYALGFLSAAAAAVAAGVLILRLPSSRRGNPSPAVTH